MKEGNTQSQLYTHACTHYNNNKEHTNKKTKQNRHKHMGKKHEPFGAVALSRERFKAH